MNYPQYVLNINSIYPQPHLLFQKEVLLEILPNHSFQDILEISETFLVSIINSMIPDGINNTQHFQGESSFYLLSQGKIVSQTNYDRQSNIQICPRMLGGKGGFGSMLRAIGAQIEKTTNREACRDLSGRRLRDINEEKRMKDWAEKSKELEEEKKERKQQKLEKMLTAPKHEFKDEEYEKSRENLTEAVSDSVEAGFRQAASTSKRKIDEKKSAVPSKKAALSLWIDEGLSSCSSDSDSDDSIDEAKAVKNV